MEISYTKTRVSCYLGYVTQATVNSLLPLLFVTFQRNFGITLDQIALLISMNFGIQLVVDLLATKFVDKIGYRASALLAHVCAAVGLCGVGIFPMLFADAYAGLVLAVAISAVGGGIIEVIISPIVEALPGEKKAASMSLLHSFYCWGCVAVIGLSTVFFNVVGLEQWYILPLLWALVPITGVVLFSKTPLVKLVEDHQRTPLKRLFTKKLFMLFLVFMVCAGAAEQAMSQWASLFAELGLGVSKTMGDLLGPLSFALFMGISRTIYGLWGAKWDLNKTLLLSAMLCVASYMLTVFSPIPLLALFGCTLCGFSVGLMWPGTISMTSKFFPVGGTAMFAILALAGDLGCASGPGVVGVVSSAAKDGMFATMQSWFPSNSPMESGLKTGLFVASIFAVVLVVGLLALRLQKKPGQPLYPTPKTADAQGQ